MIVLYVLCFRTCKVSLPSAHHHSILRCIILRQIQDYSSNVSRCVSFMVLCYARWLVVMQKFFQQNLCVSVRCGVTVVYLKISYHSPCKSVAIKSWNTGTLTGSMNVHLMELKSLVIWLRIAREQATEKWYDVEVAYTGDFLHQSCGKPWFGKVNQFFGYLVVIVIITWWYFYFSL